MSEFGLGEVPGAPDWVIVWESARAVGDNRALVEQIPGMAESASPIPTAPVTDADVWIQLGEYGYQGCPYDFAAPVETNSVCVWHPHEATRQPLQKVAIGGMVFMCCLDCAEKSRRHDAEEPELHSQVRRAAEYLADKVRRLTKRTLRTRVADDEEEIPF